MSEPQAWFYSVIAVCVTVVIWVWLHYANRKQ